MHEIQIGLAFCTPIPYVRSPAGHLRLAPVTVEWHRARLALATPTNFNTITINVDGREVGAARCAAVELVLVHDPRPEFLFFLDYDVIPQFDALTKLLYRARCFPDHDIFAGVYCCKSSPPEPLLYKGDGAGPFWDWTVGDLLIEGITGVHMGLTLIRTSLFDKLDSSDDNPLFKTLNEQSIDDTGLHTRRGTEDLWFCRRAIREAGARILVDTSVLAGHMNNGTGQMFGLPRDSGPVQRSWLGSKSSENGAAETTSEDSPDRDDAPPLRPDEPPMNRDKPHFGRHKLSVRQCEPAVRPCQPPLRHFRPPFRRALDLGAGGTRREWPGYTTSTTDIRGDAGADYCMDSRALNFPDNHFDLVASSHHLEHIPRWDQETVWKEIYRVTKPGGSIEHVVPNLEWAAAKIIDGDEDDHTMNVLYGAQEAHGYAREFNTHYFGYTPAISRELARFAGFEGVTIETHKEDPDLGYNLIIRGTKPSRRPNSDKPIEDAVHSDPPEQIPTGQSTT